MNPSESKARFEGFLAGNGTSTAHLTPENAAINMLAFYRDVRADGCKLEEDGDMLLFQWGEYDRGEGVTYSYDLTRQFIATAENIDDSEMSQLSLTIHFADSDTLRAVQPGSRWCYSPNSVEEFESFIRSHEATVAVKNLSPHRVDLNWGIA